VGSYSVCLVVAKSTFTDLNDIRDQIVRVKDTDNFPSILVGNKCDLEVSKNISHENLHCEVWCSCVVEKTRVLGYKTCVGILTTSVFV